MNASAVLCATSGSLHLQEDKLQRIQEEEFHPGGMKERMGGKEENGSAPLPRDRDLSSYLRRVMSPATCILTVTATTI